MYSVSFIIFTHLDNLRPIKKFYKKNFLSTDKVKRKFTYRVTKISDINESIKNIPNNMQNAAPKSDVLSDIIPMIIRAIADIFLYIVTLLKIFC